ncbi:uncharacterized protein LOC113340588 [Papaver somniferum]|uniref:uncharacterized protein LOC113340588 n=1 Tax=Papaver somniferum TaxID=3469 RepID=UPI000E701FD8|nr:uncharacterized protein LOC113340588 [Papaver somniferum]
MAHLVETRMSREQLEKSSARIRELEKQLAEEKKYSSKQESKADEIRMDRLTVETLNNEELNFHLHKENEGLRVELQRVGNLLTTSRNLHSSSLAMVKRLEEDKVRIIKRKDKSAVDLRKSHDEVNDLKIDNDRLKNEVTSLLSRLEEYQESEERFKNQVLHLSRQRDELAKEVSDLKEDIKYLNEDCATMEKDASKVAKITRKNAQVAKVHFFNEFCDSRGIPRVSLDLEVFSDDEPADDKRAPSDDEKTLTDEDGDDEDTGDEEEAEVSRGKAPVVTKVAEVPSSLVIPPNQPRESGDVGTETVSAIGGNPEQEVKESGDGGAEMENGGG